LAKFDFTDGLQPNVSNISKCFYFHLNLNEAFLICPDLIEVVGPYPIATNSLKCFQNNQNLNEGFWLAQIW